MVTINQLSQFFNTQTAAKLATASKNLKKQYNHRLTGRKELGKVVAHKAAHAGKLRKKEAIERIRKHLEEIPSYVNYNVNQMINVYKYLRGHRVNVIRLLEIRRDQQALMRKLVKARERFNKKIQQEINNMQRNQESQNYNYNRGGWN
jgi:cell division protein ZapA (FtsZ GTPase activity inhibitor)